MHARAAASSGSPDPAQARGRSAETTHRNVRSTSSRIAKAAGVSGGPPGSLEGWAVSGIRYCPTMRTPRRNLNAIAVVPVRSASPQPGPAPRGARTGRYICREWITRQSLGGNKSRAWAMRRTPCSSTISASRSSTSKFARDGCRRSAPNVWRHTRCGVGCISMAPAALASSSDQLTTFSGQTGTGGGRPNRLGTVGPGSAGSELLEGSGSKCRGNSTSPR